MRTKKITAALILGALAMGPVAPAHADDLATVTAQLNEIQNKWYPVFDDDLAKLQAMVTKYGSDKTFLNAITPIMIDFRDTTARIKANITNPQSFVDGSNQVGTIQDLSLYAEEEAGEFQNSIFQLQTLAATFKTLTCVKGKTVKKVSGIGVACPKGYVKKK